MGLLTNLKLRRKLLIAMAPLAVMAILASLYSSSQSKRIDSWYSQLIDHDVKAVHHIDAARSLNRRFSLYLYRLIVETDPDRRQVIDAQLDTTYTEFKVQITEAARLAPARTAEITAAASNFDQAVLESRPVRAAALANNKEKASALMRSSVDPELQQTHEQIIKIADGLKKTVDQRSDELTVKTHRSILVTWLVIGFGLLVTFTLASYVLHVDVVQELFSLRDSIQSLASGKLDQPIPFLDRPNEIGEISRSLHTLQGGAKDREIQSWVKAEVAATGVRLQAAENFSTFAASLLSRISECIPLLYGSFYLAGDSHSRLSRVGSFALGGTENYVELELAVGEGLVGQAAFERRVLDLSPTKTDPVRVSTGMGTVVPGKLLFVPLLNQDLLIGVIELATVSVLSDRQQALLDALLPSVAMNAQLLSRNLETKRLL